MDAARDALACIPPDLSRDDWVRVLAAAKAAGCSEAEARAWSAGGATYDARAFSDTWRSLNTDGGIGPGTLFFIAKEHGYRPDPSSARPPPPTAAELARQQAERDARAAADAAERQRRAEAAAIDASQRIAAADPANPQHPYLARKGLTPTANMRQEGGALLMPLVDNDGVTRGLELVLATGDKRSSYGIAKSGLRWWAREPDVERGFVVYLAEGVATALTLAEAIPDAAIASTAGAGNVPAVAAAVRQRWPDAVIVVAADADKAGREAADKAARADPRIIVRHPRIAAGALVGGKTAKDFDDLRQLAGLDEVRRQLLAEPPADTPPLADPPAAAPLPDLLDTFPHAGGAFAVRDSGVYFQPPADAKDNKELRLSGCLVVRAIVRNSESTEWGFLVEWLDRDGVRHSWVIPAELLDGDGAEVRRELARRGLAMASGRAARELLLAYLAAHPTTARAWCVSTTGWHHGCYVTQNRVYGTPADGVPVVLQAAGTPSTAPSVAGTLADWQQHVAAPAAGNTRLVLVISAAFAGALLDVLGLEGGGLHLRGASSTGKSTALVAGASIFGDPAVVVRSWDTSPAGFEAIAAQHNDSALFADESGQSDPRNFGKTAYKITNGISATRATGNGGARQIKTWRLLLISTGEISMAAHMATAGLRPAAGQELRIADIEADAGAGHGIFEHLHGHPHARALADALRDAVALYHGTAGPAWLTWLAEHRSAITADARASFDQFVAAALTNTDATTAQAGRMARRFGAVAVAGEMATRAGITGWSPGEAMHAAHVCFAAWLDGFGRVPAEERALLDGVREFLERFGSSRFRDFAHAGHVVQQLAGYARTEDDERVYLFTRTGLEEACRGADFKRAVALLVARGWIKPGPDGKPSQSKRPAGLPKTTRLYEMTDAWAAHE
ncbi:MAG: DUF927 domain-containing protein [Immundisolibacter sp.]|uniref:DUF927 domain-containing protein n=1 Tax=Immundisolibacter sp. TaxID=1934948 RepID=UPI003D12C8B5